MKFFVCSVSLEPYSMKFYEVKGKREGLTDVDEDGIVTYSSISFEDAKNLPVKSWYWRRSFCWKRMIN